MQLDSSLYYGFFTLYLGHGFAVDEELHRFILESSNVMATAAMICKKLKRMAYDAFYEDHQLYLCAVGLKKITRPKKKQKSIADMFPKRTQLTKLQHYLSEHAKMASVLTKAKLAYKSAETRATTDWAFQQMLPSKKTITMFMARGRNFLPGLSTTKLRKLISCGIATCFELLQVDPKEYPAVRPLGKWQQMVES
jgi:hypothetical protein